MTPTTVTTIEFPPRVRQRMTALERANAIRSARAAILADVAGREKRASRRRAAALTTHPPDVMRSCPVVRVVLAARGVGKVGAGELLRRADPRWPISGSTAIERLSQRQRIALAIALVGRDHADELDAA